MNGASDYASVTSESAFKLASALELEEKFFNERPSPRLRSADVFAA